MMLFLCWGQGIPVLYHSRGALMGDASNTFFLRPAMVMSVSSGVSVESRGAEPWCVQVWVIYEYWNPQQCYTSPYFHLVALNMPEKKVLSSIFAMFQVEQWNLSGFHFSKKKYCIFLPVIDVNWHLLPTISAWDPKRQKYFHHPHP